MMTPHVFRLLAPLIAVAITIVVLLLAMAAGGRRRVISVLAILGLATAFGLLFLAAAPLPHAATALLLVDGYALFYSGLILAATAAVALISSGYVERVDERPDEYYVLLLLAALGSMVLVSAVHFVSFFLGLELLSVSLYGLVAYPVARDVSVEAGVKYLVLAAVSAAFLLFGMALVYAENGTMEFAAMAAPAGAVERRVWLAGVGLIIVGFGFKLALVPFHLWTPDVYQGAPAPVTAFVATVSKGAMFALLLRYFAAVDLGTHRALFLVFACVAVASMVAGNLLALLQDNIKRLLAYSSIAHLGYLVVAFLASGALAATAVTFYLVAYFVTTIGAFAVVTILSDGEREAERLDDYRGLGGRRPWLAGVFTAMLLSLAGIPLTAGFVGKFYVTVAAGGAALWLLLVVMMITSGIGLFYYLRVVVAMFMQPAVDGATKATFAPAPVAAGLTLAALTLVLVGLGVYPAPLITLIQAAATGIG
jgi:NADH-quinone oxidoreductase subunit N